MRRVVPTCSRKNARPAIAATLRATPEGRFRDSPASLQGQGPGTGVQSGQGLYERDCAACHGAQAEGRADMFHPRLATQHYSYLLRELGLIRDGGRGNSNPAMVQLVKGYTPEQMQDVADYLSRLPAPGPK